MKIWKWALAIGLLAGAVLLVIFFNQEGFTGSRVRNPGAYLLDLQRMNGKRFGKREEAQMHPWNAADTITAVRIVASLFLLFFSPGSACFLGIYTFAGLTDVLDGWLARKTGTASSFGARLDSVADLLFCGILLFRLFPVLRQRMPAEIWYAVAAVILVRLAAYAVAFCKYHQFAALHTRLNKLTGAAVFLLPYVLAASAGVTYGWAVCLLALAAAVEELMIHLCRAEYCADRKSLFQR